MSTPARGGRTGTMDTARSGLVDRRVAHGRSPEAAREGVLRSDEANARVVARGRDRATLPVPAMGD